MKNKDREVIGTKMVMVSNPIVTAKLDELNALHEDDACWNEFSMSVASYEVILQKLAKSCQTTLEYKYCQFSNIMEAQELTVNHKPSGYKFFMNRVDSEKLLRENLLEEVKSALLSGEMPDRSEGQLLREFKSQYTTADKERSVQSAKEYADRVKYVEDSVVSENTVKKINQNIKKARKQDNKHSASSNAPSSSFSSSMSSEPLLSSSSIQQHSLTGDTPCLLPDAPAIVRQTSDLGVPDVVPIVVPDANLLAATADLTSVIPSAIILARNVVADVGLIVSSRRPTVESIRVDDCDGEEEFDEETACVLSGHSSPPDDDNRRDFLVDDNCSISSHELDENGNDLNPCKQTSQRSTVAKSTKRARRVNVESSESDSSSSDSDESDSAECSESDSEGSASGKVSKASKASRKKKRKAAKYPLYSNNLYGRFKTKILPIAEGQLLVLMLCLQ